MSSLKNAKKDAKKISKSKKLKLKEALDLISKEKGFSNWKNYKDSLDTFWYEKHTPFLNHWFSKHSEASAHREVHGGFLLTYKGQYFVVSHDYIEYIGLDSNDPIWKAIGFDVSSSSALEKFEKYYLSNVAK
jgi:hypothetical protein